MLRSVRVYDAERILSDRPNRRIETDRIYFLRTTAVVVHGKVSARYSNKFRSTAPRGTILISEFRDRIGLAH